MTALSEILLPDRVAGACDCERVMKFFLYGFMVACFALVTEGQGTIQFINIDVGHGVNAPVYESDGVTKLAGPRFMAELLVGPSAANLASIAAIGFLTGSSAGYFNGGTQIINNIFTGGTAWVEVRVWNTSSGSSYPQAVASGLPNSWWQSSVFTVTLGGGTINPFPPAPLTGLGNSPVYLNSVPEPCTLALAGLGAAILLFRLPWRNRWNSAEGTTRCGY